MSFSNPEAKFLRLYNGGNNYLHCKAELNNKGNVITYQLL